MTANKEQPVTLDLGQQDTLNAQERVIWSGRPSQLINLPIFLLLGLAIVVGLYLVIRFQHLLPPELFVYRFNWVPLLLVVAFCKWLSVRMTRFELTTERFKKSRGILLRQCDEMELYRIRYYTLKRPPHLWVLGYGNITLETSDRSHATLEMPAISQPKGVLEQIRHHVELAKRQSGVRELDVGQ